MSQVHSTSAPVYLTWAVLSSLLCGFLLFHLWKFDRFKCLRWNNGPYSGAFKRLMTYTYLLNMPFILAFSIGFSIIKYQMGYIVAPDGEIIPTPYPLWPMKYQNAIFPLQLLFSLGWGIEITTHLEELCFWLFLMHAASAQQDWFRSIYFRVWMVGSVLAFYMPIVTIVTRNEPLKSEAYTFLVGSLGDLSLTVWFMPILYTFPKFLRHLKTEGVDKSTIVRLTTFHELNCIRVVFRFLFAVPLFILGLDGLLPKHVINSSEFWTEFLAFVAAIGCVVSSGITLVIFFPRSVDNEMRTKDASHQKSQQQHTLTFQSIPLSDRNSSTRNTTAYPDKVALDEDAHYFMNGDAKGTIGAADPGLVRALTFSPNRRLDSGALVEGAVAVGTLTEGNLAQHNMKNSSVHPFVHNFTSPIDLVDDGGYRKTARLNRRLYPDV